MDIQLKKHTTPTHNFSTLPPPRLWQPCWRCVWGCFCFSPWFAASRPPPDRLPDSAGDAAITRNRLQPRPNIRCPRSALSSTWPSSKVPQLGLAIVSYGVLLNGTSCLFGSSPVFCFQFVSWSCRMRWLVSLCHLSVCLLFY